jgi:hypothetical protein
MDPGLARRLLIALMFSALFFIAASLIVNGAHRAGNLVVPLLLALLALGGSLLGLASAWTRRDGLLLAALCTVGAVWAIHAVWRLATVPPHLRAVTFGGDVVQSCLAFLILANVTMWAAGMISFRPRAPIMPSPPAPSLHP